MNAKSILNRLRQEKKQSVQSQSKAETIASAEQARVRIDCDTPVKSAPVEQTSRDTDAPSQSIATEECITRTSTGTDAKISSTVSSHARLPVIHDVADLERKEVYIECLDKYVSLLEDPHAKWHSGNGATLWDAALVLTSYLLLEVCGSPTDAECAKRKLSFVELGAGIGLPGIVLYSVGHSVISTERPLVIDLLKANIDLNTAAACNPRGVTCSSSGSIEAVALEWTEDASMLARTENTSLNTFCRDNVTVVIGSDLIFPNNEEYWPSLVNVWDQLLCQQPCSIFNCPRTDTTGVCDQKNVRHGYLSYEHRSGEVIDKFRRMLKCRNIASERCFSEHFLIPTDIHVYKLYKTA